MNLRDLFEPTEATVVTDEHDPDDPAPPDPEPDAKTTDTDLTEQPLPAETRCPNCGSRPTDESVTKHNLSNMGYLHDDVHLQCSEDGCDGRWTLGVPIGEETRFAESLTCDSCGGYCLVHRVHPKPETVTLHLKCPECYFFKKIIRKLDDNDLALVGYPQITGTLDEAEPWGWEE